MSLNIFQYTYEQMQNNTYLISDEETRLAAIIDPTFGAMSLLDEIKKQGLSMQSIWITHAHFDHFVTAVPLARSFNPELRIGLHPDDLVLWQNGGEGSSFGFEMDISLIPTIQFSHDQTILLGKQSLKIYHTPGHTPGHVIIYSQNDGVAFCGDVIFKNSIGRTDFHYSNTAALNMSIRNQILTLPPETRLLCGHGPETTVADELDNNPFI